MCYSTDYLILEELKVKISKQELLISLLAFEHLLVIVYTATPNSSKTPAESATIRISVQFFKGEGCNNFFPKAPYPAKTCSKHRQKCISCK